MICEIDANTIVVFEPTECMRPVSVNGIAFNQRIRANDIDTDGFELSGMNRVIPQYCIRR